MLPQAVNVADTAGLRRTQDAVEVEGIRRARLLFGEAHVAVLVLDGASLAGEDTLPTDWETVREADALRGDASAGHGVLLVVLNKCDELPELASRVRLEEAVRARLRPGARLLSLSCTTGEARRPLPYPRTPADGPLRASLGLTRHRRRRECRSWQPPSALPRSRSRATRSTAREVRQNMSCKPLSALARNSSAPMMVVAATEPATRGT